MSIAEVKAIISQMPESEREDFARWFEEFQEDAWDRQIAADVKSGRLDAILARVDDDVETGRCIPIE